VNVLVAFITPNATWTLPRSFVEHLRREFPQHTFLEAWDDDGLARHLAEADVAFTASLDRRRFGSLPRLKWVQSPAAGVGGLLSQELIDSPVVLTSARGIRARAIAEHVLAVTLALARQLQVAVRRQAEHVWALDEIESSGRVRVLRGRTMTIVGPGAIGTEVARLASAFGLRVAAVRKRLDAPRPPGVDTITSLAGLPELLPETDVLVLSSALTTETRYLVGRPLLARLPRGALLVNVGRGKLIDDDAVIDALRDGTLAGAALDVFTREPLDPESPYWDLRNVIVTPHTSGTMEDYWTPLVELFAENLRRFERGAPLLNVVDKKAGY
jgi:phosphoglycerate dehydrogenase-like enzyme